MQHYLEITRRAIYTRFLATSRNSAPGPGYIASRGQHRLDSTCPAIFRPMSQSSATHGLVPPPLHPALHRRQPTPISQHDAAPPNSDLSSLPRPPPRHPNARPPFTSPLLSPRPAFSTGNAYGGLSQGSSPIPGSIEPQEMIQEVLKGDVEEITQARLRAIYEEEEIDRFLRVFSTVCSLILRYYYR